MKRVITVLGICVFSLAALGQQNSPAMDSKNPVTSVVKMNFERQRRMLTAAAEEMPPDKYNYKPTEQQMTYAHLMGHIAQSNYSLCSKFGTANEPPKEQVKDTDGKDKIVAALKASFDYCANALQGVEDSKLGEPVTMYGGRQMPRAAALIALTNDFADHYAAAAMYLRLNGMLPPSAQHRGERD